MPDTIMVVDDEPNNLEVLDQLLRGGGYQARPANSGKLALKVLPSLAVDLILLDICMPDMDGYEVCRLIKANPATRDIPIIFISALHDPMDKVKAFESGGVDYICKPFNPAEVLARVSTHLQLRGLQRMLEQKVVERTAALQEANAALSKALRAKDEFLMLMSHEFRTPMNGIVGINQLLKLVLTEGQHQGYLELLESSTKRLMKLIENLLEFTKQGNAAAAGEIALQTVDVAALCAACQRELSRLAERKHIAIHHTLEPSVFPILDMPLSADRLCQIILNLLDNAIKFSPEHGQAGLDILYSADARKLYLLVWDSGPGIPRADHKRVFEPFTQLHPLTTRPHEGAGLGLALTHNLVHLHGGRIQIMDRPEGGAVFEVTLPAFVRQAA